MKPSRCLPLLGMLFLFLGLSGFSVAEEKPADEKTKKPEAKAKAKPKKLTIVKSLAEILKGRKADEIVLLNFWSST